MEAEKKLEAPADKQPPKGRTQSTIEFPYLDQENSHQIATAVHEIGGSGCDWDQLAAHLKQAAQGGGFRLRLICAKQFGLVTYDRGKVALTSLGLRIVDPQQQRAAKVESFLQVALYKAIYEKFRGGTLPPVAGLEREMTALGVAPKQADKARQAFQRSAKYAGFFEFGSDRLVPPPNSTGQGQASVDGGKPQIVESPRYERDSSGGGGSGGDDDLHPFIRGLLQKLPEPESEWSIEARAKWLITAANIFDLMYSDSGGDDQKFISVEVSKSGR